MFYGTEQGSFSPECFQISRRVQQKPRMRRLTEKGIPVGGLSMKRLLCIWLLLVLAGSAFAMTEEEARIRILEADPEAKNAMNINVYPSAEADGAYVVVQLQWNKDMSIAGNYWYITGDNAYSLGKGKYNWSWGLSDTTPEVFYNSYGKEKRQVHACVLSDGVPYILKEDSRLTEMYSNNGALMGMIEFQDYDYSFLRVDTRDPKNICLKQIRAAELTREQFLTLEGARRILALVESNGYDVEEYLFWDSSAIALNCTRDALPYHVYLYNHNNQLILPGGWWDDEIGMLEGKASATRSLDLPSIETVLPEWSASDGLFQGTLWE